MKDRDERSRGIPEHGGKSTREGAKTGVGRRERMNRGSGMKDRDERSRGLKSA